MSTIRIDKMNIVGIFNTLSKYESMIGRTFPSIAFHKVASQIKNSESIELVNDSVYVDGTKLGSSSSSVIKEYLTLGYSTRFLEASSFIDSTRYDISIIPGIGEAKSEMLREVGIKTIMDLNKLNPVIGEFIGSSGVRFTSMMDAGLKTSLITQNKRIPYDEAIKLAIFVKNKLIEVDSTLDITFAGSIRRHKSTIGDLDVIIIVNDYNRDEIIAECSSIYDNLFVSGSKKISGVINNFQVDIRFILKNEYGCHLLHATGSAEFNQSIRAYAKSKGLKLNEYCITDKSGNEIYFNNEEDVFRYLGLQYVSPDRR